jgi:hypothetical protein
VETRAVGPTQVLAYVLRQVARCLARFAERPGPDRKVAEQLDVDDPVRPSATDRGLVDVPAEGEVDMESRVVLVELGHPDVRERLAELVSEPTHEDAEVAPQLPWITTERRGIGERPEPIEAIGSAVPAHLRPRTAGSVGGAAIDVGWERWCGADSPAR